MSSSMNKTCNLITLVFFLRTAVTSQLQKIWNEDFETKWKMFNRVNQKIQLTYRSSSNHLNTPPPYDSIFGYAIIRAKIIELERSWCYTKQRQVIINKRATKTYHRSSYHQDSQQERFTFYQTN